LVELSSKIAAATMGGRSHGWRSSILAGAALILIALTAFEFVYWSMPVLPNKAPGLDLYAFGRSVLAALVSLALLIACTGQVPVHREKGLSSEQEFAVALSLALLGVFLAVFLLSPASFSTMSLEDGLVEWASALLPVAASILLLRGWVMLGPGRRSWAGLVLVVSATLLFALGMEEISWMQRIFGFHTPDILSGNIQHELNLHNLATNQVGTLHKLAGFVFLIFLPFAKAASPVAMMAPSLSALVPSRFVALIAAPMAALNYNGWDFLPMQMATYLTVGIVVYFALQARRQGRFVEAILCASMAAAIVVAQFLFIAFGDRFVRIWDITEYKELFIALGLFVWTVEMFDRLRSETRQPAIRA
jgi:hypothetical protein